MKYKEENNNGNAMVAEKSYGGVSWNVEDVLSEAGALSLNVTQKEAIELLEENEDHIKEAMVSAGWIVIQNALTEKEL